MKIVVSGGTGVIGKAAVPALLAAGNSVSVLSRGPENDAVIADLGAEPVSADVFDPDELAAAFEGADAVINLATHVPTGYGALRRSSWRIHDRLLARGAAVVVDAARRAGVRRVVQESISTLYADAGDDWVTEHSSLAITAVNEPVAVAESRVQDYTCESRVGVVLRLGLIIGDDPQTRFWLRGVAHGRPIGLGAPDGWAHVVHADDLGPALVASLVAPSGIYNIGAEPVVRRELYNGYAVAVGGHEGAFMGPLTRWLAGSHVEPLARSLRVCSDHFTSQTGWHAVRPKFDTTWLDAARARL